MSLKWWFSKSEGRETGFHDAGVETFKGNFDRFLARELIQNSLDARLDTNKPVTVKFEQVGFAQSDLPDLESLRSAFERCAEFFPKDKKATEFFRKARAFASEKTINALRVGDYNTNGVVGSDGDRDKTWYHLIRCAGSSSKGGGEGGSFGIGKNAPFAASQLRTVLYSTRNVHDESIFQGVSMLVSHAHPDGSGNADPICYLGGPKGLSVRDEEKIPVKFRRDECGTDIIVLGFPQSNSWENDLVYSVLDNFWPAIQFEDLEVIVGSVKITKASLPKLLESFAGQEDFTAHLYYRAFSQSQQSRTFVKRLPLLKEVSLYLLTGDQALPKRIVMVRSTGMVIFPKQFKSLVPFCGVFLCRNPEGNRLLREMEPPRHDVWDADHPEKGANKKIEREYVTFIRECIQTLAPADDSTVIAIPGMNRLLPDDDESPEEAFGNTEDVRNSESATRKPLPQKIKGQKIDPRKRHMQPNETKPQDGASETEGGSGDGSGGGSGKGTNQSDGGNGSGGGTGSGNAGASAGGPGGVNSKPAIPIHFRSFCRDLLSGTYSIRITPEKLPSSGEAKLVIWAVGDDQKMPVDIKAVRANGISLKIDSTGGIGPVKLKKSEALKLEVVLSNPVRVAMEVSAHEA